jgi:hypothetical protein
MTGLAVERRQQGIHGTRRRFCDCRAISRRSLRVLLDRFGEQDLELVQVMVSARRAMPSTR